MTPRVFTRSNEFRKRRRRLLSFNATTLNSVSDTLVFIQDVSLGRVNTGSKTDTLVFSQTITKTLVGVKTESISDTLFFNQKTDTLQTIGVATTTSISPCTIASLTNTINQSISFVQCINYSLSHHRAIYSRTVTSPLNLTQTITKVLVTSRSFSLSSSFSLTQNIINLLNGELVLKSVSDSLTFSQTVSYSYGNVISVSDPLTFSQSVTTTLGNLTTESLSSSLSFTQTVTKSRILYRSLSQSLTFSQSFSKSKIVTKKIKEKLLYAELITANKTYLRSISSTLIFNDPSYTRKFNGQDLSIPILIYVPTPARLKKYKFMKIQSYANVVTLPAPLFDNSYKSESTVQVKRTMTGGFRSFIKPNFEKSLKYNFILTENKKKELFSFLANHNTDGLIITDWKNSMYAAFLLTNPLSANSSGNDKVELELEFQALKLT